MKKNVFVYSLFLFIFFAFPVFAAFFDPALEINTIKTEHFYIHYPKDAGTIAQDVSEIAEQVHAKLSPKLQWTPWGRTHLVLADKTDEANGMAIVIPANYIILYITPPSAHSSLDEYKNYLQLLVTHEYTHILHIDQYHSIASPFRWVFGKIVAPNGLTPGWMREGLATWEETIETGLGRGNSSFTEMILRGAIYDNDFPKIDEAAGLSYKWPGTNSQYLFGVKFWQWLSAKYGEAYITRYIEEYSSGLWLFSLNNKARRVFNKSFYELWKEWKNDLETKYALLKTELSQQGLTSLTPLVISPDQLDDITPTIDGQGYAYTLSSLDESAQIVIVPKPDASPIKLKKNSFGQLAFSRDGTLFAFSSLSGIERYKSYSDIHIYNLNTKKTERLAEQDHPDESLRATDPDFSPLDGGNRWVVMVRSRLGTDNLYIFDREKKKGYYLTDAPRYTQFSSPRFSPDGLKIIVSRKDHEGNRDIILYDNLGNQIEKITDDEANNHNPTWSADGRFIYFDSDASGISNIYQHEVTGKRTLRITNVLTGLYRPYPTPDGTKLYATYYNSQGSHLYWFPIEETAISPKPFETTAIASDYEQLLQEKLPPLYPETNVPGAKKYSAFPQLLVPRYIVPTFFTLDDAVLLGVATGRFDPLLRHSWNLYANYRTDAEFVGAGGLYSYTRYRPTLFVGFERYALNWGNAFGDNQDFFEQRLRGYGGSSVSFGHHNVSLNYFYENRENLSPFPSGSSSLAGLDRYAGFHTQYLYGDYKQFPNSISQENGPYVKIGFDITDALFGSASDNEQQIVTGDFRYYLEMPWSNHHVLALRTAGGYAWGDPQFAGTFRFGGAFGEGALAGYSNRLFPLRGLPGITYSGDRVLLFSTEYRLPLALIDRGPGTWPLFLQKIHMAFFADYGDSWNRNAKDNVSFFEDFFLGIGAELKGDFVIGYGLPVIGRMGYAIIVLNRDQLAGLTDPLFGSDVRNGTFYLSFGTSF